MRPIIYVMIIATISMIYSCQSQKDDKLSYHVENRGALKNFMKEGDISAKANLQDVKYIDHLYALGALEDLQGEIQIWDGVPTNTSVNNNQLIISDSFNAKASLLVYASVEKWKEIKIPDEVNTYKELENFIELSATRNQIDIEEPFPFLLEGFLDSLDWHVIKWDIEDTNHTHERHRTSGLYGTLKNKNLEMLGFYSNKHHAIYTHHTTNMHLHFKTVGNDIAGHVDGLTLGGNMILKLPEK